jgi:hypothetical protein
MGKNKMKKNFIDLINAGKFYIAKELVQSLSEEKFVNFMLDITFETNLISIYTFMMFLLLEKETVFLHECTINILKISMWKGANASALLHARRVSELMPHDITKKAHVLSYFGNPDCTMTQQEAAQMAQEIVALDPQNNTALHTIEFLSLKNKAEK